MSTASGKPQGPIDLSAYVSQRARERLAPEPETPARSPYAPRLVREAEQADAPEQAIAPEAAHEPQLAPFPAEELPDEGLLPRREARAPTPEDEDAEPPAYSAAEWAAAAASAGRSPETSPYAPAQPADEFSFEEGAEVFETPGAERAASLQPGSPRVDHSDEPAIAQDRYSDRDLERLEASLRWLQRQEADVRLPRGPGLPPVQGLSSPEPRGRRYDEMPGRGVRATRSLEPERMAPPPQGVGRRRVLGMTAFALTAIGVGIGGYFLAASSRPPVSAASQPRLAAASPAYVPPVLRAEPSAPTVARDDEVETVIQSKIPSRFAERMPERMLERGAAASETTLAMQTPAATPVTPMVTAPPPAATTVAPMVAAPPPPAATVAPMVAAPPPATAAVAPTVAAPPPPPPPPPEQRRSADPEQIKLLLKQGEQFIASGDLITARTVFQRAADLGDATAAVAVGATYDPVVLQRLGVVGMAAADVAKARSWYQMAEKLGSTEATRRLQMLANR
ncbi:MAG: hypothetical protein IT537_03515 [Hyphomicrobiales bacterium]|nr:hypothetical protein [Hyphomicrobiales bacterium]